MNSLDFVRFIEDLIKRKRRLSDEQIEQITQQAIVCGQVTIKHNLDDNTFEIVNPFKGCTCEGTDET